jgi:hypothetical protein
MKENKRNREDAKVIQFPGTERQLPAETAVAAKAFSFKTLSLKKPAYGLASVILAATLVNVFLPKSHGSFDGVEISGNDRAVQSRSLASVGESGRGLRDPNYEQSLARKLSKLSSRDIASVGRMPSFEDRLRFGYLEGKYALRMNSGKIQEIEFASAPDAPKYLNDRVQFLTLYKDLLPVDFEQARNVGREVMPKKIHETYQLVQNDRVEAEVRFELDLYGRLLSMKVESIHQ